MASEQAVAAKTVMLGRYMLLMIGILLYSQTAVASLEGFSSDQGQGVYASWAKLPGERFSAESEQVSIVNRFVDSVDYLRAAVAA